MSFICKGSVKGFVTQFSKEFWIQEIYKLRIHIWEKSRDILKDHEAYKGEREKKLQIVSTFHSVTSLGVLPSLKSKCKR